MICFTSDVMGNSLQLFDKLVEICIILRQLLGLLIASKQLLDYIIGTIERTITRVQLLKIISQLLLSRGVNHQVLNTWLHSV